MPKTGESRRGFNIMRMIIINRMFSGSYLKDNIGHEWINLFRADDNGFYLYLNSDGTFNKNRVTQFNNDKKNGHGNYMLMVKNFDKGVWQVIAAAELSEVAQKRTEEDEVIVGDSVKYNGVTLMSIFSGNATLNKQDVTFKAIKVRFPASPILITQDKGTKGKNQDDADGCLIIKGLNFAKQSLRQYVKVRDSVGDSAYSNLLDIINKVLKSSKSPTNVVCPSASKIKPTTLFEVIHKQDDELMYSDMLKFYLEDEDFAKYFIKEVLKVSLYDDERIERVDREEFNIDLLIRTNKRLIVIENKIHSGINGKDKDLNAQFEDAKKALEIDSEENPISNPVTQSQLTKYYIYAELLKQNEPSLYSMPNSYFILCPEYKENEIKTVPEYKSFNHSGVPVYNIVTYKTLYDEMLKYNGWINFSPDRNKYWSEFISVMERHTMKSAFDYELEQMRLKFLQATQMKK